MNQFLVDALPYLFAFFVLDGFFLLPAGSVLFASSDGRRFRLLCGRLVFVAPTPWAEAYVAAPAPSLAKGFDTVALRARLEAAKKSGRRLSALGAALFATLFVLLPLRLFTGLFEPVSPVYVLLLAVALQAATLVEARRRLSASGVASLLLPSAAAHARLLSGKDLFADFDPVALAAALLPREEFRRLARRELTRLDLVCTSPDTPAGEAARLRAGLIEELLSTEGLTRGEVLAAPTPSDATAVAYCPLCDAEYAARREACADCGTPLRTF